MIQRIPQRTKDDCAICTVAMVMSQPYTYERVLKDSADFSMTTVDGKFLAWWEIYLVREGFEKAFGRLPTSTDFLTLMGMSEAS
jgi:hypothetical protein